MTTVDYKQSDLDELIVRAAETHSPDLWLTRTLPTYIHATGTENVTEAEALFADHHREFWSWVWALERGVRPDAFIAVWPRGGAKSTSAEMATVAIGARSKRRYALYVSGTQDQADDHVGTIGDMLESTGIDRWYPSMSERMIGKYGNSKGWRRNRLRTSSGFTVDAIGLDTASRGAKIDDQRPDLIILDDIDDHDDAPKTTRKKIDALTKAIIPAGAGDVAILGVQNVIHRNSVFNRLVDGRARFLARRIVSGPIPAIDGLQTKPQEGRDIIVAGEPRWQGQNLAVCQDTIDATSLIEFLAESQHDVTQRGGTLWVPKQLEAVRNPKAGGREFAQIVVAVDPSGGDGADADDQGIIIAARSEKRGVVLDDLTCSLPPEGWGRRVVDAFHDYGCDTVVAEKNYGGDMVRSTIHQAADSMGVTRPPVRLVNASRGKRVRAEPVALMYGNPKKPESWEYARIHHVRQFVELEDEMSTWTPNSTWSPNRVDALVWAFTHLFGRGQTVATSPTDDIPNDDGDDLGLATHIG